MGRFKVMFAIWVTFWAPALTWADMPMVGQTLIKETARQAKVELALEIVQLRADQLGEFLDSLMGPNYKLKPLTPSQDRKLCLYLGILFSEVLELMRLSQFVDDDEARESIMSLMVSSLIMNSYCGVKPNEALPPSLLKELFGDLKIQSLKGGDIKALDKEFSSFQDSLGAIWAND